MHSIIKSRMRIVLLISICRLNTKDKKRKRGALSFSVTTNKGNKFCTICSTQTMTITKCTDTAALNLPQLARVVYNRRSNLNRTDKFYLILLENTKKMVFDSVAIYRGEKSNAFSSSLYFCSSSKPRD
jgi:hypothetical protein